jgi:hypothetical protein
VVGQLSRHALDFDGADAVGAEDLVRRFGTGEPRRDRDLAGALERARNARLRPQREQHAGREEQKVERIEEHLCLSWAE